MERRTSDSSDDEDESIFSVESIMRSVLERSGVSTPSPTTQQHGQKQPVQDDESQNSKNLSENEAANQQQQTQDVSNVLQGSNVAVVIEDDASSLGSGDEGTDGDFSSDEEEGEGPGFLMDSAGFRQRRLRLINKVAMHEDISMDGEAQSMEKRRWLHCLLTKDFTSLLQMVHTAPELVRTAESFTGSNALHYAARTRNEQLLHILLGGDYTAAMNHQNFEGNTPLHLAHANNIGGKNTEIIDRLIMIGASDNVLNHAGLKPSEMEHAVFHESKVLPQCQIAHMERKERRASALRALDNASALQGTPQKRGRSRTLWSGFKPGRSKTTKTKLTKKKTAPSMIPISSPRPYGGAMDSPPPGHTSFHFDP